MSAKTGLLHERQAKCREKLVCYMKDRQNVGEKGLFYERQAKYREKLVYYMKDMQNVGKNWFVI
jgi:hypothetical protein